MGAVTDKAINDWLEDTKALIVGTYNALGIRASGAFGNQIHIEGKQIVMLEYGQWIGKNTGVRVFPPIQSILEWMQSKGIQPQDDNTPEQTAFLIARKISIEGTEIFKGRGGIPYDEIEQKTYNENVDEIADAIQFDVLKDAGFEKLDT